jgi:putative membrane protein
MKLITRLLLTALVLLLVAEYVPGITVDGFYAALIAAIVLGLLNVFVKPVLFILTLPINILTLGLFTFFINAALFLFASSFIDGFRVESFWHALLGSLIVTLASSLLNRFLSE